jgi:hypothetical protein
MSTGWIGLGVSVIGIAASVGSSLMQGAAASSAAGMNADILEKNAALDLRSATLQIEGEIYDAKVSEQNAELALRGGQLDESNARLAGLQNELNTAHAVESSRMDAKMSRIDASLQMRSARTLNSHARGVESQGRERISRFREQGARVLAVTRGRVAKAGVTMEGSPLEVMADTAANVELGAQDVAFETAMTSRSYDLQADNERQGAKRSLLIAGRHIKNGRNAVKSGEMARMGVSFAIAGAELVQKSAGIAKDAAIYRQYMGEESLDIAQENYELSLQSAGVTRASGAAQQSAATLAAVGTGINGVASAASDYRTSKPTTKAAPTQSKGGTASTSTPTR